MKLEDVIKKFNSYEFDCKTGHMYDIFFNII